MRTKSGGEDETAATGTGVVKSEFVDELGPYMFLL
jgi:hypothetical protein